ncbi:hypothetical protein BJ741DRAFT_667960 [Chytriomyces cf. hyalinus JEL632]|nr:hypothetical protein BJ741DRAFT_667960 [Chytriomyces cf. hyalinus JEL632]
MSTTNLTGIIVAYPTQQSATCSIQASSCRQEPTPPTNGTINNSYTFCANKTISTSLFAVPNTSNNQVPASLFTPPNAPRNQTLLPAGLTCDSTPSPCQRNMTYTCTCYLDLTTSSLCTLQTTLDNGPPSILAQIQGNTLYYALAIAGVALVSLCLLSCLAGCFWRWASGGHGLSPRGIREFNSERKRIKLQRMRDNEAHLDELARAKANELRRFQELETLRMQQHAHKALEAEKAKLATEKEMAKIEAERHALIVADTQRRQALTQLAESSEDQQLQREANREILAIAARKAQREELEAVSGSKVKVVETARIENGQTVYSTDIHRERIANTDRDAQILMDQVNREKAAHTVPAVTASAGPSDDPRLML